MVNLFQYNTHYFRWPVDNKTSFIKRLIDGITKIVQKQKVDIGVDIEFVSSVTPDCHHGDL